MVVAMLAGTPDQQSQTTCAKTTRTKPFQKTRAKLLQLISPFFTCLFRKKEVRFLGSSLIP